MAVADDYLRYARSGPRRLGRKEMIAHLEGKALTRKQAMDAKCYECNGMGESDYCDIQSCPLLQHTNMRNTPHTTREGKRKTQGRKKK